MLPLCRNRKKINNKQTNEKIIIQNCWNGSFLVLQLVGEPVEALIQAVSAGGTGGLDVPAALAEGVQAQLVCDLCSVHGVGEILEGEERASYDAVLTIFNHLNQKSHKLPSTVEKLLNNSANVKVP